jgi:hypothetical protein
VVLGLPVLGDVARLSQRLEAQEQRVLLLRLLTLIAILAGEGFSSARFLLG